MSIDREDGDERQAGLACMIDEFRKAQARRLAKAKAIAAEPQAATDSKAVGTGSATSQ